MTENPELWDLIERICFVTIGWVLAVIGTPVIEHLKRNPEIKKTRIALANELYELQYRLALTYYYLEIRYGTFTQADAVWLNEIVAKYNGVQVIENIKARFLDLVTATPAAFNALLLAERGTPNASLLKKVGLTYLDSRITTISWFRSDEISRLTVLKNQLAILNEIVDDSRYFYNLTFQNITDENHATAANSVRDAYRNYAKTTKVVLRVIKELRMRGEQN